jgi:hypothetical protein
MTDRELAEYLRGKLNFAVILACQGEQERRSGHWEKAAEYQRQWEDSMEEVKHLLPVARESGVSLFPTCNPASFSRAEAPMMSIAIKKFLSPL